MYWHGSVETTQLVRSNVLCPYSWGPLREVPLSILPAVCTYMSKFILLSGRDLFDVRYQSYQDKGIVLSQTDNNLLSKTRFLCVPASSCSIPSGTLS